MEYQALLKELLSDRHKPLYVIVSDENFYLERIADALLKERIPAEQQDFNQLLVYGRDIEAKGIVDFAREYPFMGERKLILVKDAQEIKDWEPLIGYAKSSNPTSLLVMLFGQKPDGRSSWVKTVKDLGFLYEFKAPGDYQIPKFVNELANEFDLKFDEDACLLLIESIGNDLSTYYNEMAKLKLNVLPGKRVDRETVSRFVGISKEFNMFELQRAFSKRDKHSIYWIASNMSKQKKANPLLGTVAGLFLHFQKIWLAKVYISQNDDELSKILKLAFKSFLKEYRTAAGLYSLDQIEKAISILKEYDLKSKGMNTKASEEDLYIELALSLSNL